MLGHLQKCALLSLVSLVLLVSEGFCCSCRVRSKEDMFCSADFALRARVLDRGTFLGDKRIYTILPVRFYRSKVPPYTLNLFQVVTASHSAACGVELEPGQEYFFTGHFEPSTVWSQGRMTISLCDWITKFDALTSKEQRLIEDPYICLD